MGIHLIEADKELPNILFLMPTPVSSTFMVSRIPSFSSSACTDSLT